MLCLTMPTRKGLKVFTIIFNYINKYYMLKYKNVILLCGLLFAICVLLFHIKNKTEEFTPSMKVMYRPHIRNAVFLYDTYFNYCISKTKNLLKKYRLI